MIYNLIEVMFMDEWDIYQPSVSEALYAQIIGRNVMRYLRDYAPEALGRPVESEAVRLLERSGRFWMTLIWRIPPAL